MHYVRMETDWSACCMTGEMCHFQEWEYDTNDSLVHTFGQWIIDEFKKKDGFGYADYYYGKGETLEAAWQAAYNALVQHVQNYSYTGKQVRYFWFVDYTRRGDRWKDAELRTIIQQTPNVVKLGEYANANTGHLLDGYMVVIENENGSDPDEENDDYDY